MMPDELGRSCWTCGNSRLCYLKRRMESLIKDGINILNIDGAGAPGECYTELHAALAKSCMLYKENPDA